MTKPNHPNVSDHPLGLHPGATWRKTEMQVHTPRDPQWEGERFSGTDSDGVKQRIDWAKRLIRDARKKRLDVLAITDHHDLAYIEPVRAALKEMASELSAEFWVFPGMEVTCDDSMQCLVLMDPAVSLDTAERLYGALPNVTKHPYEHKELPQTQCAGIQIDDFVKILAKDTILSKAALVLPHAGKDSSHKTVFRKGFHSRFANLECDGFYIEHPLAAYDDTHLRRLRGQEIEWGVRRRGVIATGDNRTHTFDGLGRNPCWVRMGEPSVESLRQALLADEARISFSEPTLPAQRILWLEVKSQLCPDPLKLTFNDGFTALIGGRGTGKSALLEYLRFGIARSVYDLEEEATGEAERLVDLIQSTLGDGYVSVGVARDGIEERWTRRMSDPSKIVVNRTGGPNEEISIDVAQERFQARAYHQKQLSTLEISNSYDVGQITGIAAAEVQREQNLLGSQLEQASRTVGIAAKNLFERWKAMVQIEQCQKRSLDVQQRSTVLQEILKGKGVSQETQDVLTAEPVYRQASQYFADAETATRRLSNELVDLADSVLEQLETPTVDVADEDFKLITKLALDVSAFRATTKRKLTEISAAADALILRIQANKKEFGTLVVAFDGRLDKARTEQKQHRMLLDSIAKVNNEVTEAGELLKQAKERGNRFKQAEADFIAGRTEIDRLLRDRNALLANSAKQANEKSEGRLKATTMPFRLSKAQYDALCEIFEGTHARDVEENLELFSKDATLESWVAIVDAVLDLCKLRIQTDIDGAPSDPSSDTIKSIVKTFQFAGIKTPEIATRLWRRLSPSKVEQMLTARPDSHIEFEYRDEAGAYISFARASQGQQAAALLTLLLNQKAGTLIIDQPEEDLDNQIIMEIVKQLRSTKSNRQLIFATHNANFVVNGDADKVVSMGKNAKQKQNRIALTADGAIETPRVRDLITKIMEGGEEAFKLRGRKYLI